MSGLPRQILKWLQGLDLSYSVRNTRRDFANGFLIAEIMSRYYRNEIQMHSYDNGLCLAARKDNWNRLLLFFKKLHIAIDEEMIDHVMYSRPKAIKPLITVLYEFLTGKKLPEASEIEEDSIIPPYAKQTASNAVAQTLKDTNDALADITQTQTQTRAVVETHKKNLRKEKNENPGRYQVKVSRVPQRTVNAEDDDAIRGLSFVKEVNVKRIDENVTHLRQKGQNTTRGMSDTGRETGLGPATVRSPMSNTKASVVASPINAAGGTQSVKGGERCVEARESEFVRCIGRYAKLALKNIVSEKELSNTDAVAGFVKHCINFPAKPHLESFFHSVASHESEICLNACRNSVKDFWEFVHFVFTILERSDSDAAIIPYVQHFSISICRGILEFDSERPFALLCDFGLIRVHDLLCNHPKKRAVVLELIYGFVRDSPSDHIKVLNKLHSLLEDSSVFIACVAHLIKLEKELNGDLSNVYVHYTLTCIQSPRPSIRACALSLLSTLARQDDGLSLALRIMGRLMELTEDAWWEVQVQLYIVCSVLMLRLDCRHSNIKEVQDLVRKLLSQSHSDRVMTIGFAALCQSICNHMELLEPFVARLLAEHNVRRTLISLGDCPDTIVIDSSALGTYKVTPVQTHWSAIRIVQAVAKSVQDAKLGNLEQGHLDLLFASIGSLEEFPAEEAHDWVEMFDTLKDYLLVELCDERVCEGISELLLFFLDSRNPQIRAAATSILKPESDDSVPPLFGILKLVFPDGASSCREVLISFLSELTQNETFFPHVYTLVQNFRQKYPIQFSQSDLKLLLNAE